MNARCWSRGVALAAVLLLAGCGGGADSDGSTNGAPASPGEPADGDRSADLDTAIEAALAHAGAADDLAATEIEVVTAETVTWPDGALGCPQPGEMYTQALVEGYRIVLSAGGELLTYHGSAGDEPFRCEDPQEPVG